MSHETLLHRLVRPLVRRLAASSVQPNHVSLLRLASAAGAAGCFATGTKRALWAGSVLFTCSALLDRTDGELARHTGQITRFGHKLDLIGDCMADAGAFLAIGFGARKGRLGRWAPLLGLSAAVSVVALFVQLNSGSSGRVATRLVDADDAILVVPPLLLGFGCTPVVALAGTITPAVALYARHRGLRL